MERPRWQFRMHSEAAWSCAWSARSRRSLRSHRRLKKLGFSQECWFFLFLFFRYNICLLDCFFFENFSFAKSDQWHATRQRRSCWPCSPNERRETERSSRLLQLILSFFFCFLFFFVFLFFCFFCKTSIFPRKCKLCHFEFPRTNNA